MIKYIIYIILIINSISIMRMLYTYAFLRNKRKILKLAEKNKKLKNFIFFLITNDLYKYFIHQLYNEHKIKNIDIWIKTTNESFFISKAFKWKNTKQGYDFWYDMNLLWNQDYKHRNIDFLIVKNLIEKRL